MIREELDVFDELRCLVAFGFGGVVDQVGKSFTYCRCLCKSQILSNLAYVNVTKEVASDKRTARGKGK